MFNYTASHNAWGRGGFVLPEYEFSDSQFIPGDFKPAAWLPLEQLDDKFQEYRVIAAGKPVAIDRQGRLVPAGYKFLFEAAGGSTVLTYDATDVSKEVVDLTTGSAVSSATSYTQTELTTALRNRQLISASETARDFISWPIGYAPNASYQWVGGDGVNPAQFRKHNHNLQNGTSVGFDMALQVPMVPAQVATETQGGGIAIAGTAITYGTAGWKSSTGIAATSKYSSLVSAGDNIVAMVLDEFPVAKITDNTPITDSASTLASMTEVSSIASLKTHGSDYFYIDYDAGVLFLYEEGGNAIPTGFSAANTITYYSYESVATGTGSFAALMGDVKVGDWVTFDSTSSYVKFNLDIGTAFGGASGNAYSADPDYDSASDSDISSQLEAAIEEAQFSIVGQVVAIHAYPQGGLDKVMTQYDDLTTYDKMSGTATGGVPTTVTYSGGANLIAVINFCTR